MTKKTLHVLSCVLLLALITASSLCSYALGASNLNSAKITSQVQPTQRITQNIDERVYVALSNNTRPEAKNALNYRGPAAASLNIDHILLFLQRSPEQEQALNTLIEQLNDRKSPEFHRWLTAEEIGQRFGVAPEDINTVTGWLQSHGLRINKVYTTGMLIDFSGTAGQVGEAFHTQIGQLEVAGESHIANMSDPMIPAALAPVVSGIFSLNDFKPHAMNKPISKYTFSGCTTTTDAPTEPGTCYSMTPQDTQTVYNLTPLYNAGFSGQGQTIALVEDTDTYSGAGDWNTYRSTFGLSTAFPLGTYTQSHPGGCTDPGTNADDGEAAIDVEVASAVAPSAAIELISCEGGAVTFGGLIAMQNLVAGSPPYPGVMSISYGVCEAFNGNGGNQAFYNTYQTAALEGISVFGASGDEGPSSCSADFSVGSEYDVASLGISGWTSTPFNVSVGGTDFEDTYNSKETGLALSTYWNASNTAGYGSAKSYIPEMPWDDSCANLQISRVAHGSFTTYGTSGTCNTSPWDTTSGYLVAGAGSGGASNCFSGAGGSSAGADGDSDPECQGLPKPGFQSGSALNGGLAVYGSPSDGVRDIPDVSMFAANGVWGHFETVCWSDPSQTSGGAATCTAGEPNTWSGFGGTSIASPTMAGIQALINQETNTTWGNPNPIYYQIAQNEYGTAGGTFQGTACNSSGSGGPAAGCAFNDVTEGDIDLACEDNGTLEEAHCYKPSGTFGVDSTDAITAGTVLWGGSGYTTAPTCTIAGPTNNSPYLTPTLPSGRTQVYAGGTQATCTAAVLTTTTTAKWTVAIESVDAVGDTIILTNVPVGGSTTCGPYTLAGASTTAIATALVTSATGCSLITTPTRSGSTVTFTAVAAGAAGNFITEFGPATEFDAFYVYITNTTKGQGPNYVSGITIGTAGSGYQPETPITLGGPGTGAVAVANTSIGTAPATYQPAYGAAPGYDLATGLGTPNATNLVSACAWLPSANPGIFAPVNGSILTGPTAAFLWYPNASASNYWVDVGSTYGGNNYEQSGPLSANGCGLTVKNLPENGSTIYVTWWYEIAGTWAYTEYTYTAYGGLGVIYSPANGATLGGSSQLFQWSAGAETTGYWLTAGNAPGGNNYYSSGPLSSSTLSITATNLPTDGSQVYVTLFTDTAGEWLYNQYQYTAAGGSSQLAQITSPPPGEVDGTQVTFNWTAGSGGESGYWLDLGTYPGGHTIYQSGNLGLVYTTTVFDMPNDGSTVYGTMWTLIGGQWYYNQYSWQSGPGVARKAGHQQLQKQLVKR